MAIAAVNCLPEKVEAGNTYNVLEAFTDYPTTGYALLVVIVGPDGKPRTIATTISGTSFAYTLPLDLIPGLYDFAEYATETATGQRATAHKGTFEVIPNLMLSAVQTNAQTILANIEAIITTLSSLPHTAVTFAGQSYTQKSLPTLRAERTYWKAEVVRERERDDASRRGRRSGGGRVQIRFTPDMVRLPQPRISEY
jgi:hypothetical protein